jgi:hypothetical protein
VIIITILKIDSGVNLGQDSGHGSEGQPRLTHVNIRIKVVIIIVLKPDSGVDWDKALLMSQESQHGFPESTYE